MNKIKSKTPGASKSALPKKPQRTLTLVRNGNTFYPHTDDDYLLLSELKIPLTSVSLDYYPLLRAFCKKQLVVITTVFFSELEEKMIAKIVNKWQHDLICTPHSLVFSYPRTKATSDPLNVDGLVCALQAWYSRHRVKTEIVYRRTAKNNRLFVKKVG